MTDHELLKMAAKALGWVDYPDDPIEMGQYWHTEKDKAPFGKRIRKEHFNPLEDDGDALRLAVKIYMFDGSLFKRFMTIRLEETRLNPARSDEEITRRAIVRVAAEIGRGMK